MGLGQLCSGLGTPIDSAWVKIRRVATACVYLFQLLISALSRRSGTPFVDLTGLILDFSSCRLFLWMRLTFYLTFVLIIYVIALIVNFVLLCLGTLLDVMVIRYLNVIVLACVCDFHSSAEGRGHPVYPERNGGPTGDIQPFCAAGC